MIRILPALALFSFPACTGSDDGPGMTPDAAPVFDAGGPDAGTAGLCYPEGIYGSCADLSCSNCLRGASVYQVCTSPCTDNSACGDAADFAGASPLCAPLNPGSPDMICVLTCAETAECPCGLECRESGVPNVKICAETL